MPGTHDIGAAADDSVCTLDGEADIRTGRFFYVAANRAKQRMHLCFEDGEK